MASQPHWSALLVPGSLVMVWCRRQPGLVGAQCWCWVVPVPGGSARAWYWSLVTWSACDARWCQGQMVPVPGALGKCSAGARSPGWSMVLMSSWITVPVPDGLAQHMVPVPGSAGSGTLS